MKQRTNKNRNELIVALSVAVCLMLVTSFATTSQAYAQNNAAATINGAGATFPYPLIDTWRVEYSKENLNVNINYQSIGSGGGIKQFTEMTVDFGATDAPMTQAQRENLRGDVVHIPETIGSVVAVYNIPEVPNKGLKLTGQALADIFLGKIKKWNDPQIAQLNPDLSLPPNDIVVVHSFVVGGYREDSRFFTPIIIRAIMPTLITTKA